jgi:hypothetical protein
MRTVLLPACAPNAGAKLSSPLVVSRRLEQRLQLLTHTSLLGGRRLWAAAQQHGCRGEVLRHLPEEWRGVSAGVDISRCLRPRWRAGHCCVFVPGPATSACGPEVVRQPGGAPAARCSPRGAAPTQECSVQVVNREALGPSPAPSEEGSAPRRAGAWPLRARRVVPIVGRRWRGAGSGSELLDVGATQMLHSRVGSRCRVVRALRVVVDPGATLVARKLLTYRHRVVREARLSTGVHHGVPLHELPKQAARLRWPGR